MEDLPAGQQGLGSNCENGLHCADVAASRINDIPHME
jgi:hypothetical protein